jgi:hypothetical protein
LAETWIKNEKQEVAKNKSRITDQLEEEEDLEDV